MSTLSSGTSTNKYLYNGKELENAFDLGWYDYGARFYDVELGRWHSIDPLAENYSSTTPYAYVLNSPINAIDPNGMSTDWVEDENKNIYWDENATSQETTKEGETYLGKAVVVFNGSNGSTNEQLGEDQNLYGEGADLADITVYGPNGESDVKNYKGFTMSSNSKKFGVVADGRYTVNRLSSDERKGPYGSDLILESRVAEIPALNDFNPAHPDRKPGYLEGVFIHGSNNNGWAGTFLDENSKWHGVSQGCLLIAPKHWDAFEKQLMPVNSFPLMINRK